MSTGKNPNFNKNCKGSPKCDLEWTPHLHPHTITDIQECICHGRPVKGRGSRWCPKNSTNDGIRISDKVNNNYADIMKLLNDNNIKCDDSSNSPLKTWLQNNTPPPAKYLTLIIIIIVIAIILAILAIYYILRKK